jgi:hypothetical protein
VPQRRVFVVKLNLWSKFVHGTRRQCIRPIVPTIEIAPQNCLSTWRRSRISSRNFHRVPASSRSQRCRIGTPFSVPTKHCGSPVSQRNRIVAPASASTVNPHESRKGLNAVDWIGHAFSPACIQHPPKPRSPSRHNRFDERRFTIWNRL